MIELKKNRWSSRLFTWSTVMLMGIGYVPLAILVGFNGALVSITLFAMAFVSFTAAEQIGNSDEKDC